MITMDGIKPRLVAALKKAGYLFVQQSAYEKWTKGRNQSVWIGGRQVRATRNTKGADLVCKIMGVPNGSVSEEQQERVVSWYTDGYRSRGSAAI